LSTRLTPRVRPTRRDQWLELKGPEVAGYTYDAHKNLMLKKIKRAKKEVSFNHSCPPPPSPGGGADGILTLVCCAQRVRIDLILSRSKNWRPAEVLLLGTRPIEHVYNGTEVRHCPRR
jgi:hypothetical protein